MQLFDVNVLASLSASLQKLHQPCSKDESALVEYNPFETSGTPVEPMNLDTDETNISTDVVMHNNTSNTSEKALQLLQGLGQLLQKQKETPQAQSSLQNQTNQTTPYITVVRNFLASRNHQEIVSSIQYNGVYPGLQSNIFQPICCSTPLSTTSYFISVPILNQPWWLYEFVIGTSNSAMFLDSIEHALNYQSKSTNWKQVVFVWCQENRYQTSCTYSNIMCTTSTYAQTQIVLEMIGWLVDQASNLQATQGTINIQTMDQIYQACCQHWNMFNSMLDYYSRQIRFLNDPQPRIDVFRLSGLPCVRNWCNRCHSSCTQDHNTSFLQYWLKNSWIQVASASENYTIVNCSNNFISRISTNTSALNDRIPLCPPSVFMNYTIFLEQQQQAASIPKSSEIECVLPLLNLRSCSSSAWNSSVNRYFVMALQQALDCSIGWTSSTRLTTPNASSEYTVCYFARNSISQQQQAERSEHGQHQLDQHGQQQNFQPQAALISQLNWFTHYSTYQNVLIKTRVGYLNTLVTTLAAWLLLVDSITQASNGGQTLHTHDQEAIQVQLWKLLDTTEDSKNQLYEPPLRSFALPSRFIDIYYYRNHTTQLQRHKIPHILFKSSTQSVPISSGAYFTVVYYIDLNSELYKLLTRDNHKLLNEWVNQKSVDSIRLQTVELPNEFSLAALRGFSHRLVRLQEMCLFLSQTLDSLAQHDTIYRTSVDSFGQSMSLSRGLSQEQWQGLPVQEPQKLTSPMFGKRLSLLHEAEERLVAPKVYIDLPSGSIKTLVQEETAKHIPSLLPGRKRICKTDSNLLPSHTRYNNFL